MFRNFTLALVAFAVVLGLSPAAARAQEAKEKPAMYSYIANWAIPRAKVLEKALSDGTLVAYGNDVNLVHTQDGETNDGWWSSMSLAGLMNVLDQLRKSASTQPVFNSATKHWDEVLVSHYYNWKPGSYKGAYTHVGVYKLKADAPDDAVERLSKNLVAPFLEKLLSDGTIVEYEIDTAAVHTAPPGYFLIVYVTPNADGLDKVNAALDASFKSNPLGFDAFGSMEDFSSHRDELLRTDAVWK